MTTKKIMLEIERQNKMLTTSGDLLRQCIETMNTMGKSLEQQNAVQKAYEQLGSSSIDRALENMGYDSLGLSAVEQEVKRHSDALNVLQGSTKRPWEILNDALQQRSTLTEFYQTIYAEVSTNHLEWLLGQSAIPEYLQCQLPEFLKENKIVLENVTASQMASAQAEAARIGALLPDYLIKDLNAYELGIDSLGKSLGLPSSLAEQASYTFKTIETRVQDIAAVLKPAAELCGSLSPSDIFDEKFLDLTSALKLMSKVDSYIGDADRLIGETNALFSSSPGIASLTFNDPQSVVGDITGFDRLRSLESSVIGVGAWSESALHRQTSELIVSGNDFVVAIRKEIKKEVGKLRAEIDLSDFKYLSRRMDNMLSPQEFKDSLIRFASACSRDHCMVFWRDGKDQFVHKPELLAKNLLGAFLNGCYGDIAFVGQEIIAGPGFIDLLVNFMGTNNILELKIVGSGWSVSWAEEGVEQLDDYMERFNAKESYLILFDGRKTKKGRQLEDVYITDNGTVHVININISPFR